MARRIVHVRDKPVRSDLLCPHCEDLLELPVQTDDGVRLCTTCFETIANLPDQRCLVCQVTATSEYNRDKAVEREIQKLEVWCFSKSLGCSWQGKLNNWQYNRDKAVEREIQKLEEHAEVCQYKVVKCPNNECRQVITACELEHHVQECQFQPVTCDTCHMPVPLSTVHDHELKCGDLESYSGEGVSDRLADNVMPENRQVDVNRGWILSLFSELKAKFTKLYTSFTSKMWTDVSWLKNVVMNLTIWRISEEEQNLSLRQRIRALEEATACDGNGTVIWRIPNISQHRRNAISGSEKYQSKNFYLSRPGYKFCLRAYFNGDGTGEKTHLSLFFAVMRGDYDDFVSWPFKCKVTLTLMDHTREKNIVETFNPNPDSNSFQRPTTEMNIASGCPKFAKLSVLEDPRYVRDDVIFIKCKVDISGIIFP